MKTKVALINVRIEPRQYIPINLLILAGFVESLCEVVIFDPEHSDNILEEIKSFKPDIIGISTMTPNYSRAKQILSILREEFGSNCRYVIGGIHPSLEPIQVLKETQVDAVVVGEGEYAFADIIRGKNLAEIAGVYIGQEQINKAALIEDLNVLPLPGYHLMPDLRKYLHPPGHIRGTFQERGTIALMSSRACPAKCIFCSSHLMFGRQIRRRSVDNMISEIKYLMDKYGKTSFWFADDTFTYQKPWVYEFCEKVHPLKISWGCQGRSDTITDELVLKLKAAGCQQIDVGVESGSDRVLKTLGKGETRQQHLRALHTLKRHRMRSLATFMVGTPGETVEDVELTKSLIKETKPSMINVFYITPFPHTALFDMVEERGLWIHKEDFTLGIHDRPVISDILTEGQQIKLCYELYALNRWRNLQSYISVKCALFMLGTISLGRIFLLINTLIRKNFHHAMYAYIQDYRKTRDSHY